MSLELTGIAGFVLPVAANNESIASWMQIHLYEGLFM
jgi:hypothetical protein